MRRLSLLLALICMFGVVACGEEEDTSTGGGDARELLQRAFNTSMESGRLALDADVQIDGPDEAFKLKLSGPFVSNGGERLPSIDLDVRFSGGILNLTGGLVLTEDNAFVSVGGEDYEIGEELIGEYNRQSEAAAEGRTSLEDFGIAASRWLEDPEVAGGEEVAGTSTTKISGEVDAARVIADFVKLDREFGTLMGMEPVDVDGEELERLAGFVEESRADVYVADDGTLRRLGLDVEFQVPEALRDEADGIEGGSAKIDLTFSDVGEPQEIEVPEDARPIDELLGRFGLGAESRS